ncbi:MAG: type I-U CRISPR-associated helicase/endonuclease Cas3 [Acidobacteriia bacterium]|nr:type I-U CRISPR-associated helicase/endonuclease Cas3 [Terriglobia bacterium]
MTFREFFQALWGPGKPPFPWQEELARRALAGEWPRSVGLPTAAGKTALLDIAVYALAKRAPNAARRIFFVVDRRVIVDEAAARADTLAKMLEQARAGSELGKLAQSLRDLAGTDVPLITATLRGGIPRENWWTDSPVQPAIACSTVDQIGSSLLFQAYGVSRYARPIRAGLAAYDSLIILDEAHTSQPFAETLRSIGQYRGWADQSLQFPLTVVEMSATPRGGEKGEIFEETEGDRQEAVLKRRWETEKRARLIEEADRTEEKEDRGKLVEAMAREARALRDQRGAKVIGVIANRVETARQIYESLRADGGSTAVLLTGRARPYDRDRIWEKWKTRIGLERESDPEETIFVVATQCIEVGANIDFDGLVTEIASIDALEQRFGRLARNGRETPMYAAIVALKSQIARNYSDPIYGAAPGHVWRWLKERIKGKARGNEKFVGMGVAELRAALRNTSDRAPLVMPRVSAPVLMPSHLDLLCQTAPEPAAVPEAAVFLHGPNTEPADVQVIWRQDLEAGQEEIWSELAAICPPTAAEAIALPVWAVRKWLANETQAGLADLEGAPGHAASGSNEKGPVLAWRGEEESEVLLRAEEIRPGMTIVVPASYGGCDEWGWRPGSTAEVADIGDAVKARLGHPMLRLHSKLAERWNYTAFANRIQGTELERDAREALGGELDAGAEDWVKKVVSELRRRRTAFVEDPADGGDSWAAAIGRSVFEQESRRASYTSEVRLERHLEGCANWAAKWALKFEGKLPEQVRETVIRAAALHDIGKADPRFQAWLRGGNAIQQEELLAKSGRNGQNPSAIERARKLAGYPKGGRHELMSVALLEPHAEDFAGLDYDLLLHLIASHHGRCRPFAPVIEEDGAVAVAYGGWEAASDHRLEVAGSGISERYWGLVKRYGWYGLAFLESLVRLADQRQSEQEQEKTERADAAYA